MRMKKGKGTRIRYSTHSILSLCLSPNPFPPMIQVQLERSGNGSRVVWVAIYLWINQILQTPVFHSLSCPGDLTCFISNFKTKKYTVLLAGLVTNISGEKERNHFFFCLKFILLNSKILYLFNYSAQTGYMELSYSQSPAAT